MSQSRINVLVTGANGGLGLGICLRLIDDFLSRNDEAESLNIIYTTRSVRKGSETLRTLQAHLRKHHPIQQHSRMTFQPENVELTSLVSVRDLAHKLVSSTDLARIDAVICNAGIGGWTGLDWYKAVTHVLADLMNNTVWPAYKLGTIGSVTKLQLPQERLSEPVPPLGELFCANLFGHYMLVHWLMPLLRTGNSTNASKIIWVSSIEPQADHFQESDMQGLQTDAPYEHSKRLTDILSLTYNQPATQQFVKDFTSSKSSLAATSSLPQRADLGAPAMHVYHPGIVVTSVISLYWIIHQAYLLSIYLARWIGSPWSTVEPYAAAHGATWLALTSEDEIQEAEVNANARSVEDGQPVAAQGRVKWGTAITRGGKTTVRPTEVDKWGVNGSGHDYATTWWGGANGRGRKPGAIEAKSTDVEEFIAQGVRAWDNMEVLRKAWEKRLDQAA
ncbi:3-keto-steroid reductase [Lithohypha guttulata]|uniref:3-keto-steroid reductase n=1 Tax=Lithohypha guttulata TaxID=1690604 RepID=A0AAN7SMR0_9EURO|nr:3-keto-steroid reductase [Lithohypha guttulata]